MEDVLCSIDWVSRKEGQRDIDRRRERQRSGKAKGCNAHSVRARTGKQEQHRYDTKDSAEYGRALKHVYWSGAICLWDKATQCETCPEGNRQH